MNYRLFTIKELCKRYAVSKHTIRNWIARGKITYTKVGGSVRFREEDLLKWEEENLVRKQKTELL